MNLENVLKTIRIACNIADWFSVEQHVDYDFDLSLGILFAEGRIVFSGETPWGVWGWRGSVHR